MAAMMHCNNKTKAEGALNGFMQLCLGRFPFFFFFAPPLLYFGCCFLVFSPLPWGTLGREGGCALGGQLCAALTGCV